MKNMVYILKDVYKALNKIKRTNERKYKKMIKKIVLLEKTKIEKIKKISTISAFGDESKQMYLYIIDKNLSLVFMIFDQKIYIMDMVKIINGEIDSILIKYYEGKKKKNMDTVSA